MCEVGAARKGGAGERKWEEGWCKFDRVSSTKRAGRFMIYDGMLELCKLSAFIGKKHSPIAPGLRLVYYRLQK